MDSPQARAHVPNLLQAGAELRSTRLARNYDSPSPVASVPVSMGVFIFLALVLAPISLLGTEPSLAADSKKTSRSITTKRFEEAEMLAKASRNQDCLKALNNLIAASPGFAPAYVLRGWQLLILNKPEQSMNDYNRAIKLDPGNAGAYKARGFLNRQLKHFEQSRLDLEKAARLAPGDAEIDYLHGITCLLQGLHNLAIKDFSESIKKAPHHPYVASAYYWRGRALQMMEKDREAVADFTRCMEKDPGSDMSRSLSYRPPSTLDMLYGTRTKRSKLGLLERGISNNKLGRFAEAEKDFDAVLAVSPDDVLVVEERGNARLRQGKYKEATLDFNRALLKGTPSTELYYKLGLTNFCEGKYRRSALSFDAWFERNGFSERGSALALLLTWASHNRLRDAEAAADLLEKASAARSNPATASVLDLLKGRKTRAAGKTNQCLTRLLMALVAGGKKGERAQARSQLDWILKNVSRLSDEYTVAGAELKRLDAPPARARG